MKRALDAADVDTTECIERSDVEGCANGSRRALSDLRLRPAVSSAAESAAHRSCSGVRV